YAPPSKHSAWPPTMPPPAGSPSDSDDKPLRSRGAVLGDHGIAEDAQAIDFDLDDVAGLEPDGGFARHADTRRGAGEDQVAGLEGEDLREIRDQLVDPEDELAGGRVLHGLAVEPQADAQVVGVGDLIRGDEE